MTLRLLESILYREPSKESDATEGYFSRAWDIITEASGFISYQESYEPLKEATIFKETVNQKLLPSKSSQTHPIHQDRVYHEVNWPFARNLLCRKFVKGIKDDSVAAEEYEDPDLVGFQTYLCNADRQHELRWSYFTVGATSDGRFLAGTDRVLYHFGFDWVGIIPHELDSYDEFVRRLSITDGRVTSEAFIVRRSLAVAVVLRMESTEKLISTTLCPLIWASTSELMHRRTLVLFNEIQSPEDPALSFRSCLSPDADEMLWQTTQHAMNNIDNETTAVEFIQRLLRCIWNEVVGQWGTVLKFSSEHLSSLDSELVRASDSNDLQTLRDLANEIGRDSSTWFTLTELVQEQYRSLNRTSEELKALRKQISVQLVSQEDPFQGIFDALEMTRKRIAEDFRGQTKNLTGLVRTPVNVQYHGNDFEFKVYNAMAIQHAQTSLNHSTSMKRLSWITFVFLPLVFIASVFGMNVDMFANDPSISWYFIVSFPFMALLLALLTLLRVMRFSRIWSKIRHLFGDDD